MPEKSTGAEAWALTNTSRASSGGKVSSGGPPDELSTLKNALTPRERRGSTSTSIAFSSAVSSVLIMIFLSCESVSCVIARESNYLVIRERMIKLSSSGHSQNHVHRFSQTFQQPKKFVRSMRSHPKAEA